MNGRLWSLVRQSVWFVVLACSQLCKLIGGFVATLMMVWLGNLVLP